MHPIPVIIVSYNTRNLLRECLASLALSSLPTQAIVVDNASHDGSVAMVQTEFPQAHVIESGANLGFAKANNLGIRQALLGQPNYLLLLNPDAQLTSGALETLVAFLEQHSRVGMVAPRLLYPDGSFQAAAFRFPTLLMNLFDLYPPRGRGFGRLYNHPLNGRYPQDGGDEAFAIDHPLGAAMLVRAETLAEVGLLNEDFWLYAEEVELCWRIRQAGWAIWQEPQATVIHYGGASSSQFRVRSFLALQQARSQFFGLAYSQRFNRWHRRLMTFAGLQRSLAAAWQWQKQTIDQAELRRRTWAWAKVREVIQSSNQPKD
ncbi:glycosyltransferase family 2 protein [Herpetosiphon gulosus]|uniref:N-acetylglucosaminyl-diphospho-decaprenol L-rhamnosyltransferase n=1 Tax=Herpetosiphon gulosus TaxID=1973496 RepID=A0ABP9X6P9_9CHLR